MHNVHIYGRFTVFCMYSKIMNEYRLKCYSCLLLIVISYKVIQQILCQKVMFGLLVANRIKTRTPRSYLMNFNSIFRSNRSFEDRLGRHLRYQFFLTYKYEKFKKRVASKPRINIAYVPDQEFYASHISFA